MAKPTRSPLLGYNHNVKYGGQIFHVQTEDSGPGNPHIFTHLFFEGSILGSKRTEYDPATPDETVRGLMQSQHKAILKELKQKLFDERIISFFQARGQSFQSEEPLPAHAAAVAPAPETVAPAEVVPDDAAITTPEAPPEPTPEPPPESTPEPASIEAPFEAPLEAPLEAPVEALLEVYAEVEATPPAEAAVLDLDALPPPPPGEPAPTPEPLPMHLTRPAVPGPGTYTFRRPTREQLSMESTSSAAHPPARPTATPGRPAPTRIMPVVMQRQVVVGAGGPPATTTRKVPTTPVRRRPVSGGPYVVKEGSHADIGATVRRGDATRPVVTTTEPAQAPRTAEPPRPPQAQPQQEGAPAAFVTDQSLDDVILAYLSQGDGKP